jgi:hypothetical protein
MFKPAVYIPCDVNSAVPFRCLAPGGINSSSCRERSGIQKHCKSRGYKILRTKGRPNKDTDQSRLWVENQTCQWFFRTGKWQKISPVQVAPHLSQAATVDVVTKANEWMDELFTDMDQEQERAHTERNRYEPNPWLEHTG